MMGILTLVNRSQTEALSMLTVPMAASYRFSYSSACAQHGPKGSFNNCAKTQSTQGSGSPSTLPLLQVTAVGWLAPVPHLLRTPTCVSAPASRSSVSLRALDLVRSMTAPPWRYRSTCKDQGQGVDKEREHAEYPKT